LYDALAGSYDEHFAIPHRRAYDDLAWEVAAGLIEPGASVLDVGCGVGRWAQRLIGAGHRVTGIEPAPRMADAAEKRLGPDFPLIRARLEDAAPAPADVVLAMGSLQYATDPGAAIARCAGWLRPAGALCVLVDSRQALVLELLSAGRTDEALERLTTKRALWQVGEHAADLHLLDSAELTAAVRAAGLRVERVAGLLVGATVHGRDGLLRRLTDDYPAALAAERRLAAEPALSDLGKQLLVVGRKPGR
jgi:SAM-dependent methyltransferase